MIYHDTVHRQVRWDNVSSPKIHSKSISAVLMQEDDENTLQSLVMHKYSFTIHFTAHNIRQQSNWTIANIGPTLKKKKHDI